MTATTITITTTSKQAGTELGQAQVKLDDIVVFVVKAMVEVEVHLLFRVGGWLVVGGWLEKRN